MTETTSHGAPPDPSGPLRAPLLRSPDDRVLLGVCAAVGRSTGTDPVLWRVLLGVLAVFGGAGLALYLVGVLLIPRAGEATSLAERAVGGAARTSPRAIAAVAVAAVLLLAVLDDARGLVTVAVVGAVAYLVHRERTGRPLVPSPPAPPPHLVAPHLVAPLAADPLLDDPLLGPLGARPYAAGPPPAWGSGTSWEHAVPAAPLVARAPRSRLGAATLSLAALAAGAVVLVQAYGAQDVVASDAVTAALLVVGGGLVVGTWWGRARWLVPVGVLLAVLLGVTTAAERLGEGGVGTRAWVVPPSTSAGAAGTTLAYRLSAGEATLDLGQLRAASGPEPLRVDARVGVGELVVLVPDGLTVHVEARVRVGELLAPGVEPDQDGSGLRSLVRVGEGQPDVVVEASLGAGTLDVRAS